MDESRFNSTLIAGESIYSKDAHPPTKRPNGLVNWIINLTISGRGIINSEEDSFEVNNGDLLIFPNEVVHDYTHAQDSKWHHLWIYFVPQPKWVNLLKWPVKSNGVMHLTISDEKIAEEIRLTFEKTIRIYQSMHQRRLEFCHTFIEEILFWCSEFNPLAHHGFRDPRIQKSIQYLIKNLEKPLSIEQLARIVNLSPSHYAHLFKEMTTQTPIKYIETLRIWKAQELLISTSNSITQIANDTGFLDSLYFSRVFRKNCGKSPSIWRANTLRQSQIN